MRRFLSALATCLLLNSCSEPQAEFIAATGGIPELEYVVITYGNDLEADKKLFLSDSRAYYNEDAFELVWMKYTTQQLMDLCDGRDLIVYVVENFLEHVNNNPWLPFFVDTFPFTPDNLIIDIVFESFFGKYVDPLYLARIRLEDGMVYYYANNAIDPDTMEWAQRVEPYDKAYRFSVFKAINERAHPRFDPQLGLHPGRESPPPQLGESEIEHSGLHPRPVHHTAPTPPGTTLYQGPNPVYTTPMSTRSSSGMYH